MAKTWYTVAMDLVKGTTRMGNHLVQVLANSEAEAKSEAKKKIENIPSLRGFSIQGSMRVKK